MKTSADAIYRFGQFEVNAASGELFRNGKRVKLQEQPFRLLVVLLEHAGEVVSREELRDRIWPEHTFVDFDGSLRVAVRKLREALGDDAEVPRYVETVHKHGYRFLEPAIHPAEPVPPTTAPSPQLTASASRSRQSRYGLTITIALAVIIAAAFWLLPHRHRKVLALTEKDTIVLADFQNSTGDPVFDGTLREGLAIQLAQSPSLSIVSDEQVQQTLKLMAQKPDAKLTPAVARDLCQRTGSAADLEGSIAQFGEKYLLTLKAVDCANGQTLASTESQASNKNQVLDALDRTASDMRTKLGESLATVEKFNTPLEQATTPSLDALNAYSEGMKVARIHGEADDIPFFKRAVEIDPDFAIAYAFLGLEYSAIGEPGLAAEYESKAYELRDRANDNERFFITAYYDGRVTGNMEKARQTSETWAAVYPRNDVPPSFLAGFIYPTFGEYEKAGAASERAIELSPEDEWAYVQLASSLIARDRLNDADSAIQKAHERGRDSPDLLLEQHDIAFLTADKTGMERLVTESQETPDADARMSDHQAAALAFTGRLRQANLLSQRAIDLAQNAGYSEQAGFFATRAALREAFYGNTQAALQWAKKARELAQGREVEYGAAFALAVSENSSAAEASANDLEKRYPEDTAVRFSYLPALRARLALNHRNPSEAIERLQPASNFEFASPRSEINGFFGAMYPVYERGEAYLAEHRGAEAAIEFQKILDHPGIVVSDPIAALAHLQLGRAYAMSGDNDKAKAAYSQFLTLWKNADPDIPILNQAKAEYAKLK